jgi:leader peptidase (prepilin peptidase)/N-methyltransferase
MPVGARFYFDALVFAFGACMGSFLNVCIHRIPLELSVITPRSRCPNCMTPIAWHDNIPLMSYLALRARCRKCAAPISPRYFIVELLVAVLFVLVWLKFAPAGEPRPLGLALVDDPRLVPVYWLAVFGLALGTFVDLEHMIIPDRVSLGGIVIGIALSALLPALHSQTTVVGGLTQGLIGAVAGSGILWGVALLGKMIFRKDAMGMGDVKLLGAIGAFLGWPAVLFTVMVSSLIGALVGVSLVAGGRKQMQSRIPFGPYLALAALIWILWGPTLWDAYTNWLIPPPAVDIPASIHPGLPY